MLDQETQQRHLTEMDENGFTVVENALTPSQVEELKAALIQVEAAGAPSLHGTAFEGLATVRIYNLLAHHPAFQQIPVNDKILPLMEQIMDAELQLSSLSAICPCPGETAQPIHADDQLIPLPKPHPALSCNSMFALTDFTEENGATRIIPGSHKWDHSPGYGEEFDSIAAEMKAGSVLLFHGSVWHGGGANRTDQRRLGIACYYCAGYIRQQENQQLGIPTELLRTFPKRLKELCGFSLYKGMYGHVERTDPIEFLGETSDKPIVWDIR